MSRTPPPTADLIADDRGRYVDCNELACELLGYSREELLKLSVWDLTPEGNEVDGLVLWQDFIHAGAQAGIYWLVRKDGSLVEVEYRAVANATPGGHLSRLTPIDTGRPPFPLSKLPRRRQPPEPGEPNR
jgi:PAS domain S-box-containing protein